MLHSVDWCLVTNGSVQHIGPILRVKQALKNSAMTLENGTDNLSRDVGRSKGGVEV